MAVIWQKNTQQKCYQVRKAGNSIRLYTNGVFHSQFNPMHPVSGSLWDLLSLPAYFFKHLDVGRVCLLGVGGGAVIRQLQALAQVERIDGVDLDPVHLYVAKKYFGNQVDDVSLFHADAVDWVSRQGHVKKGGYSLIIEDLFGDMDQDDSVRPCRAIAMTAEWLLKLQNLLAKKGILVINLDGQRDVAQVAKLIRSSSNIAFEHAVCLTHPRYLNHILVLSRRVLDMRVFKSNLQLNALTDPRRASCKLQFMMKRISLKNNRQ